MTVTIGQPLKLEKPPYDFAAAFHTMAEGGAQMVLLLSSPSFVEHLWQAEVPENRAHRPVNGADSA